jgi:transposase-like protein
MEKMKNKRYSAEFKQKMLKEVSETKNVALVAQNNDVSYPTLSSWIRSKRNFATNNSKREEASLLKRLEKVELENRILKELLKKTNQAWLTEDPLPSHSLRREM